MQLAVARTNAVVASARLRPTSNTFKLTYVCCVRTLRALHVGQKLRFRLLLRFSKMARPVIYTTIARMLMDVRSEL